jgi:hypothetical protein
MGGFMNTAWIWIVGLLVVVGGMKTSYERGVSAGSANQPRWTSITYQNGSPPPVVYGIFLPGYTGLFSADFDRIEIVDGPPRPAPGNSLTVLTYRLEGQTKFTSEITPN